MICIKCRKQKHKKCKTWPAYDKPEEGNQDLKTWCFCAHQPENYSQGPVQR